MLIRFGSQRDAVILATGRAVMLIGAQLTASNTNPPLDAALADLAKAIKVVDDDHEQQAKAKAR